VLRDADYAAGSRVIQRRRRAHRDEELTESSALPVHGIIGARGYGRDAEDGRCMRIAPPAQDALVHIDLTHITSFRYVMNIPRSRGRDRQK
jgi:hypothetical protein